MTQKQRSRVSDEERPFRGGIGKAGRKLAEEALRRRPELKILYTSGYSRSSASAMDVQDAGVDMIGKPFTVE